MRDLFRNIPLFVVVFVFVWIVRAVMGAMKAKTRAQSEAAGDESDEQRRVREIQERIRRIAAERRGEALPRPSLPAPAAPAPRTLLPPPMPPLDPFGGPERRVLTTFERRVEPVAPPPLAEARNAELARQEELQEAMRQLEEQRMLVARHQAQDAAERTEATQSEAGLRTTARARLLEDLRDPQGLRRAFVLREVLGTPVGLR